MARAHPNLVEMQLHNPYRDDGPDIELSDPHSPRIRDRGVQSPRIQRLESSGGATAAAAAAAGGGGGNGAGNATMPGPVMGGKQQQQQKPRIMSKGESTKRSNPLSVTALPSPEEKGPNRIEKHAKHAAKGSRHAQPPNSEVDDLRVARPQHQLSEPSDEPVTSAVQERKHSISSVVLRRKILSSSSVALRRKELSESSDARVISSFQEQKHWYVTRGV